MSGSRLYLSAVAGTPLVADPATWDATGGTIWTVLDPAKNTGLFTTGGTAWLAGQLARERVCISAPLQAQTISGTVAAEIAAADILTTGTRSVTEIYVVDGAASVVRGTLLLQGVHDGGTGIVNDASGTKFYSYPAIAAGTVLTPVAALAGDRLVVATGYKNPSAAYSVISAWGSATNNPDIPDGSNGVEVDMTRWAWAQFSQTLIFQSSGLVPSYFLAF